MSGASWQARLEHLQATGRLPSVVAGVLQDGDPAWTGGVNADLGTQYRIGSITKTMTAVAVMQLRDEGLLALDDPIGRFLPESGYGAATLRQLLSHTSGMQSEPVGSWWERSPGVDFAALTEANDGSAAVTGAGEWFHYSNLGFALLGEVVARLRGAPWWEVISARLLGPLEMKRTTYDPEAPYAQGLSVDHFAGTLTDEPHQDTASMAPAGQLWSTVEDLARWARLLMAGHPDVIAETTLREMSGAQAPATDHGLGLAVLRHDGRAFVGHTGSMPGFQASLFVDPDRRDGAVVLTNATTGFSTNRVLETMFGGQDPTPVGPWRPTVTVPPEVHPILGVWFWGNTAVELRWQNDELQLRAVRNAELADTFELREGRLVGTSGYHRGETLHVVRSDEGTIGHLDCATFIYTRVPYDPAAPIPGGPPSPRDRSSSSR